MTDYEFTLKFALPDASADPDRYVEALAKAGCDDALVGIGQRGRIALAFTRSAKSAQSALVSALRDVRKAIPNATLVEASPDFVGLTDVADIVGFTRQNMRKLMLGNVATFPAALHDGNPSLWHLASILTWLKDEQQREIDDTLLDVAKAVMRLNIAKETRHLAGVVLPKDLARLFA